MEGNDVLGYYDYRSFLIDHAESKKQANPSWSLGTWATKLGLGGTASISRILTGERVPGDDLTQQLISYFQFNEQQSRYFQYLVTRDRYYRGNSFTIKPEIILRNGLLINMVGILDPDKTKEFLAPFGLEPVLVGGFVIGSVNVNFFPDTTMGRFSESYTCIPARPFSGGILDMGLYFSGFIIDEHKLVGAFKQIWGHEYNHCKMRLTKEPQSRTVSLGDDDRILYELPFEKKKFTPVEEKYEMFAYASTSGGLAKTKFSIDTIGRECPFDPLTDHFDLDAHPEARATLLPLDFKPQRWVMHENLYSLIYAPTESGRMGSY